MDQNYTKIDTRSYAIDVWRFVFCVMILFFHAREFFGAEISLLKAGNFGVNFYFILSGYLLNKSIKKEIALQKSPDTWGFLKRRFLRLLPWIWVPAAITFFIRNVFLYKLEVVDLVQNAFLQIWEVLLLVIAGFTPDFLASNYLSWYVSSLLVIYLIFYPIMRKNQRLFARVIAPLLVIFLGGWLIQQHGTWVRASGEYELMSYFGLKRGVVLVAFGVMTHELFERLDGVTFTKVGTYLISFAELFGYILSFICVQNDNVKEFSPVLSLFLGLSIALTFSNQTLCSAFFNSIFTHKTGKYLEQFTTALMFSHVEATFIYKVYFQSAPEPIGYWNAMMMYLPLCVVVSIANLILFHYVGKFLNWNTIKNVLIQKPAK